jgi:acetolactate synthase small subunit
MNTFDIHYRNTQGTLMRILNAVSRRALDLPYIHTEPTQHAHRVTLTLDVTPKQIAQLSRDWYAIVDVIDVRAGALAHGTTDPSAEWTGSHPATSVGGPRAVGALA